MNKVKHGDKSKVNNLNNDKTSFGSFELMIVIKIFSK